jgi:hypothetical protein
MNKKFDELLHHYTVGGLQTHLLTIKYGPEQVTKECKCLYADEVEKFAELIVRECAEIADATYTMHVPAGPVIKEHFGVKE